MNCESFDHRLDALLDGACAADEWREAELHASTCSRCHRLLDGVAGRGDAMDDEVADDFTASILARTSGTACATARDRLCDFVDGELTAFDRELVQEHLHHCGPCAELARELAHLHGVLPAFAELPVPADLERRVILSTSRRPAVETLESRVWGWLGKAVMRPRFALEAAYVCTLLLVMVFGDPVKAFRDVSVRVEPDVKQATEAIGRPIAARAAGVVSAAEQTLREKVQPPRPEQAGAWKTMIWVVGASENGMPQAVGRWVSDHAWTPAVQLKTRVWNEAVQFLRTGTEPPAGGVR
jgi:predicted anti-sigma-YlaC factor YlaD